jgi:hypothetical protein
MYLLTASKYPKIAYIHEPLSYFRAHEGSITVSKEKHYLSQCYRQARLWFAEQYLDDKWLKKLYVYEWKRECKETGRWTLPGSIFSRYSKKRRPLSLFDIISGLLTAKSIKKGKCTMQRGWAAETTNNE